MITILPLALIFSFIAPQQNQSSNSPLDLIHVQVANEAQFQFLNILLHDVDDHQARHPGGAVVAYATDLEQNLLSREGFRFEVITEDLADWYARRAESDPSTRSSSGTMGGFRTLAEIGQELDRLANDYPNLVSVKQSIGSSIQGRDIWMVRVSDNPNTIEPGEPTAWFDALHHAREPMSAESLLLFIDWICQGYGIDEELTRVVDSRNLLFVPCVNPDGYEDNRMTNPNGGGMWRKNRRANSGGSYGVDLNRNYDWAWGSQWGGSSGSGSSEIYRGTAPFSEPETASIRDASAAYPPGVSISTHTYSNLWLFPWSYDTIFAPDDAQLRDYAMEMTANNGYAYGTSWEVLYVANGVADDYAYGQHGAMAFTPEIGNSSDGFWPAPSRIPALFEDVRPGYLMCSKWAGAWADIGDLVWNEKVGDGDPFVEAGETWGISFQVDNRGMEGLALGITPSAVSSFISVSGGSNSLQVPSWSSATSPEWDVSVSASAPSGAKGELDLSLEWDGITTTTRVEFSLGRPRLLVHDDMETSDFGWEVSNSTNYSWERSVPQITTSNSQTVQPGTDNPGGTGSKCWVTGAAAGSSVGANDVDGTTWLTSPVFSALGFGSVQLEYARWFANLPGGPLDDRFLVQVSNDAGSNWVNLEEIANANSWRNATFSLGDFVTLSSSMRLRFRARDEPNNDLTEACIDDLKVEAWSDLPTVGFWGSASLGSDCSFFIDGEESTRWDLLWSFTSQPGNSYPGYDGLLYLKSPKLVASGATGSDGRDRLDMIVPSNPVLLGRQVHFQALLDYGGTAASFSNHLQVVFG